VLGDKGDPPKPLTVPSTPPSPLLQHTPAGSAHLLLGTPGPADEAGLGGAGMHPNVEHPAAEGTRLDTPRIPPSSHPGDDAAGYVAPRHEVAPRGALRKQPALDFGVQQRLCDGKGSHTAAQVDPPRCPPVPGATERFGRSWELLGRGKQPHAPCRSRCWRGLARARARLQRAGAGRSGNGARS